MEISDKILKIIDDYLESYDKPDGITRGDLQGMTEVVGENILRSILKLYNIK